MKNIKNLLENPLKDARLWALWIWNKDITEDEMINQINSFIEKGFGGVAIRPGREMKPVYLSEEFLSLFEKVCVIAKENGINIRIADDFSLPWNGFFQSHAEQNSSYRAQKLVLEHTSTVGSKEVFEYSVLDESEYIVLVAKITEGKINPNTVKIIPVTTKNSIVSWKSPAGDWQVMVFKKTWYLDPLGYYVPNVFNPKVAQVYIQVVLEKLKSAFSKFIPAPFEGFICEMPTYLPSENGIPWDDDLIIKYKSRYKKNLVEVLPSLFFEVDDNFAKNRSHVYHFILQAMYERFPLILETWAKKHRISQWVLSFERDVNWAENALRDVMAIPTAGLSSVGMQNQDGTERNYAVVRAMADMNSIEFRRETIAVVGRNRQNGSGTLQSIKEEIDQHAFLGTSKIILDGCYFNLDQRSYVKSPYNPSWYHPDWDQMQELSKYTARLLTLSRNLQQSCSVAVVMPSSSIMADYLPSNDESVRKGMHLFRKVVDTLQCRNIEFDVVSEQFLISCLVKSNGEFGTAARIRKGNYSAVIFPFARLISNSTFVFLEKLAVKKGMVIFINEAPQGNFDDGQSASFTARVTRLTRPRNDSVHIVSVNDFVSRLAEVEQAFSVTVGGKACSEIQTTYGSGNNYDIFYLHNSSVKRDYFTTIECTEKNHIYLVDCHEGELHEIENVQNNDGLSILDLDIAPKQTCVLLASDSKVPGVDAKKDKKHPFNVFGTVNRNYRVVLKDRWSFSPDANSFNVLPLASWNKRIGLSRDSGGYSHYYEAYFETEEVPQTCMLVFCGISNFKKLMSSSIREFEVSVNGIVISPFQLDKGEEVSESDIANVKFCGPWSLKFDIRESVMKGINRVSIRTIGLIHDPGAIVYPPIIAGGFSIKKGSRGWTIDAQKTEANYGSWTKHGFPYLSGSGTYEQIFEVPTDYQRIVLKFNQVSGSIIPEVNGHSLGILNWQPLAVDITKFVEQRRNLIKVSIVNTFDNLLRMNGRASGLLGEVYLDVY